MSQGFHIPEGLAEIAAPDLGHAGPLALLEAEHGRALTLLETGRARFPAVVVALADRLSRRWLEQADNPYLGEIRAVAAALPSAGAYYLNVNLEWGCTTAVAAGEDGAPRFLRALDWPFDGLGEHLVAARFEGAAGPWINLTWPGFVGCIQGFAPGRFAASINQAPQRPTTGLFAADWAVQRGRVWRRRALPPAHLLRLAFETAADYDAAKRILMETPLALPAIFTLAGNAPGERCIIERLEDRAYLREGGQEAVSASNHWQTLALAKWPVRGTSAERNAQLVGKAVDDPGFPWHRFTWLEAPVLNFATRLAMVAEPANDRLSVLGIEGERATNRLSLGGQGETEPAKPLTGSAAAL